MLVNIIIIMAIVTILIAIGYNLNKLHNHMVFQTH